MLLIKSKIYEFQIFSRKVHMFEKKIKLYYTYGYKFSYEKIIEKLATEKKKSINHFETFLVVSMAGARSSGKNRLWNKLSRTQGEHKPGYRKIASLIFLHDDFMCMQQLNSDELRGLLFLARTCKNSKAFDYLAKKMDTKTVSCTYEIMKSGRLQFINNDFADCNLFYASDLNRIDIMNYFKEHWRILCEENKTTLLSKVMKMRWNSFVLEILESLTPTIRYMKSKLFRDEDKYKIYDYFMKHKRAETSVVLQNFVSSDVWKSSERYDIAISILEKYPC